MAISTLIIDQRKSLKSKIYCYV